MASTAGAQIPLKLCVAALQSVELNLTRLVFAELGTTSDVPRTFLPPFANAENKALDQHIQVSLHPFFALPAPNQLMAVASWPY